eukprot:scaffold587_cov339-Pavlova_lutheri.AAC.6
MGQGVCLLFREAGYNIVLVDKCHINLETVPLAVNARYSNSVTSPNCSVMEKFYDMDLSSASLAQVYGKWTRCHIQYREDVDERNLERHMLFPNSISMWPNGWCYVHVT